MSTKKSFALESDLRRVVRDAAIRPAYWIEPAQGSTDGLPDVAFIVDGLFHGIELKVGTRDAKGRLAYKVRPAQRDTLRSLGGDGAPIAIAVAEIGTRIVHIFDLDLMPGDDVARGKVDLSEASTACRAQWDAASDPTDMSPTHRVETLGMLGGASITWVIYGRAAARCFRAMSRR